MTAISRTWHTSTYLTSITPLLLTVYLYSASKWRYQVFENTTLTSRNVWTKALVDVEGYVWRGKAALGYSTWLPHCWTASTSSNWCWRSLSKVVVFMFHLPQGTGYNWGSLGELPHPPPSLARFHPMAQPPWGFNTSWTTFGLRHALFTTVLRQTPFYMAAFGHLVIQRLPPVLEGGGVIHKTGIYDMPICQLH